MPIGTNERKMLELFFSYDRKRVQQIRDGGLSVAHYTTADTAMKIITGKSLWLRNCGVMNDYSEVEFGRNVIAPVTNGHIGARFRAVLEAIDPGLHEKVMKMYGNCVGHAREVFFTSSLSEHCPKDRFGRLSMWRAYGGPVAGVALLFKGDVVDLELEPSLELSASPVLYGGPNEFHYEFEEMVRGLEANIEFLKAYESPEQISHTASALLQYSMLSIKHAGFEEEKEWRIIHRPYEFGSAFVTPRDGYTVRHPAICLQSAIS